jgi:hypothetical protein
MGGFRRRLHGFLFIGWFLDLPGCLTFSRDSKVYYYPSKNGSDAYSKAIVSPYLPVSVALSIFLSLSLSQVLAKVVHYGLC